MRKIFSRKIIIAAVIVVVAAVGIVTYNSKKSDAKRADASPADAVSYVKTETVRDDRTIRSSITQNMSIEAVKRVQILPRVTGRLERMHVRQGDKVKAGQLIATLEHTQQDALISSTEAQIASAKADSERSRAEMMNAKTNLDRYKRLVREGFSTQQQYDTTETAYISARANYNAALAKERQAASEFGRVRSTKQDYIMYSPIDGTVLSDYSLTSGAMISPTSPISDIADLRRLKASLRIPENKIFAVKPGMDVFLKFDAISNEEFKGKVTRIDQYVDPATRTSAVEIELDNEITGGRLRPGMFGQASIVEREYHGSIAIPEGALNSAQDGYRVFVDEGGTARRRDVKAGITQNGLAQITEGLKSGDSVITFGAAHLSDGDRVEVR
ncbi:RND transporter [Synergistales bacterium]|nr:RND transporter [Synergistales bacterium]